ncbi:MAG TPA: hypothetical protein VFE30_12765 [Anaeromyxobacteraceae bacterium]|nr:hypothetical protein [Anaeromyxobacteraceae bacterium]
MSPARVRPGLAAALACALAAASPSSARAEGVEDVEVRLRSLEADLATAQAESRPPEGAAERARRAFAAGRARLAVQDFAHAAALLTEAAEAPSLQGTADGADALWLLALALDGQGSVAAAARALDRLLALPGGPREREALPRAVDLAFRAGRHDRAVALAERARAVLGGRLPPDLAYTAAKAAWRRRDLPDPERRRRAASAFEAVPPPHQLAAAYFQGVLQIEGGSPAGAVARFEACTRLDAQDARQREIRELCHLALGRLHGDAGRTLDALAHYQSVSRDSPRFDEALHEMAWTYVRAKKYALALRIAALLSDLAPESPLAPEAVLLRGQLELRLGRWRQAVESYERVVNRYGPVRDELEAILSSGEDPLRSFNEILGRPEADFDAAAVLPPLAARWAAEDDGVKGALALVGALDQGRRDLREASQLAARLSGLLAGGGTDSPRGREGLARLDAVANGLLRARFALARAEAAELELGPAEQAELARLRAARRPLEERLAALPASGTAAAERIRGARARVEALDAAAFQLGYAVRSEVAAIAGTQGWLGSHRADVTGSPADRAALTEELRKHREIVAGYEEEVRQLRLDLAQAEDSARLAAAASGEELLRTACAERLAEEEALLARARQGRAASERLRAIDAARARAAALEASAAAARARRSGGAGEGLDELRARVQAQADELGREQGELDQTQEQVRLLVGKVTRRSLARVQGQFQRLVLEADVGLVDVAWARKRERVEKIQQLSMQKQADLDRFDAEFRDALREVEP